MLQIHVNSQDVGKVLTVASNGALKWDSPAS